MKRLNGLKLGGATAACALGIGYVMQFGFGLPNGGEPHAKSTLTVTEITPTSSAVLAPRLPTDLVFEAALPGGKVENVAATGVASDGAQDSLRLPSDSGSPGFDCKITMSATAAAGAMAKVSLNAPCHASERVTIHHQGLMFTELVQPDGSLLVNVPALSEKASFIASFASGDGAMAVADVSSLSFYDRVVVQWKGEAGLQLHAREFTNEYFSEHHIWAAAAGDLAATARGEGGFLTRLGREDMPDALVAEIYSYPSGTSKETGDVLMSVEAEVTARNCGGQIAAQTLELRDENGLRVRDLTLEIPACDSIGDFLVLKNLVEDLKIAAR